jgi:hypothetical protein
LLTHFDGDPAVADLMRRARDRVLRAMAYQELPFTQLVEYLQPLPATGQHPIFQTMLA